MSMVSKVVKSADTLYWSFDKGVNTVSDCHVIFQFGGVCEALYARFRETADGVMLCSRKQEKEFNTFPVDNMKMFDKFLHEEENVEVVDTRLEFNNLPDRYVRVLHGQDHHTGQNVYNFLATHYFACIKYYERIYAEKASKVAAVTFVNAGEKAVILPVNVMECGYLAELK